MRTITVECEGVHIGLAADGSDLIREIQARLLPGWRVVDDAPTFSYRVTLHRKRCGEQYYTLDLNARELCRTYGRSDLLDTLLSHVHQTVAEHSLTRIFVHAGVVGWRGGAILIPGRSYSGKSTLVSKLARLGAEYYSDEYAVLGEDGLVYPYPRSLCLRVGCARKITLPVSALGTSTGTAPLPARLVVVTSYDEHARWKPIPLTTGESVLAVFCNTVRAQLEPERTIKVLCRTLLKSEALRTLRPNAEESAQHVLEAARW